jgi:hypothetical protein
MQIFPAWARHAILITVLLFGALVSGLGGKVQVQAEDCTCGNVTITVDHAKPKGVDRKAVYLCPDYTVTWVPGPHVQSFRVVFVDPPFGNATTFDNSNPTTPKLPDPGELTVFKYNITVTNDNGVSKTFDPHVIGSGR